MNELHTTYYDSEIGFFKITGSISGVHEVQFLDPETVPETIVHPCLTECVRQLDEYFSGTRTTFDLSLKLRGTTFQKSVWHALSKIPFGRTVTYMDIARSIGNRKAIRAVGAANGQNPIPVIVPCHRVIGSGGSLVGFGGGIWRKEFLLRHEKILLL